MLVVAVRDCASLTMQKMLLGPGVVPGSTIALYEKTLSPAVTSPCVASSYMNCSAPPMSARLQETPSPVLVGFVPGVTETVRSVVPPGATLWGSAAPVALGGVLQAAGAAAVFRGVGAPVAKSEALLSVSMQPTLARRSAVVLLGAAAAPDHSNTRARGPQP